MSVLELIVASQQREVPKQMYSLMWCEMKTGMNKLNLVLVLQAREILQLTPVRQLVSLKWNLYGKHYFRWDYIRKKSKTSQVCAFTSLFNTCFIFYLCHQAASVTVSPLYWNLYTVLYTSPPEGHSRELHKDRQGPNYQSSENTSGVCDSLMMVIIIWNKNHYFFYQCRNRIIFNAF